MVPFKRLSNNDYIRAIAGPMEEFGVLDDNIDLVNVKIALHSGSKGRIEVSGLVFQIFIKLISFKYVKR